MSTLRPPINSVEAAVLARFGPRPHLQLKEIAELLGLKTTDALNEAIRRGELKAKTLFGHCPRLRWVSVSELVRFLDAAEQVATNMLTPNPPTKFRDRRALTRVAREGRGMQTERRTRTVS